MTALTSNLLHDLVEHLFSPRRRASAVVAARASWRFSAVSRLAVDAQPAPQKADDAWLGRVELRGSQAVINMLEAYGLRDRGDEVHALFVDGRCGLIRAQAIANASRLEPRRAVADILAQASNCHADGIILATHDAEGKLVDSPTWKCLVRDLHRKGEATEIFLLDHFILTNDGWQTMVEVGGNKRS